MIIKPKIQSRDRFLTGKFKVLPTGEDLGGAHASHKHFLNALMIYSVS